MRVLLANEPRAYREALGAALRALRPNDRIRVVEPARLAEALERCSPHLVVCSDLTLLVGPRLLAWAVLYPNGASHAELCLNGRRILTTTEVQLEDLLTLADRTAALIRDDQRRIAG